MGLRKSLKEKADVRRFINRDVCYQKEKTISFQSNDLWQGRCSVLPTSEFEGDRYATDSSNTSCREVVLAPSSDHGTK